jgi:hypothetical protein
MPEIDPKRMSRAFIEIFTLYQSLVTKHGVKDIAYELKKSTSTIYAEISIENLYTYLDTIEHYDDVAGRPTYLPKLGLVDFLITLARIGDLSPLVAINSACGMACHPIPAGRKDPAAAAKALAKVTSIANKECTDSFNAVIQALAGDGVVDRKEAETVIKEGMEAVNALLELVALARTIARK